MLIWLLLLLGTFERKALNSPTSVWYSWRKLSMWWQNKRVDVVHVVHVHLFSLSKLSVFSSVCSYSLLEEELGKQTPAYRPLSDVAFYRMMDCLYLRPFWSCWQTCQRSDLGFLFWSPQTSYLRVIWVESSHRRSVQRGDDTLWLQVIISAQTRPTMAPALVSAVMVTSPNSFMRTQHFSLFRHFVFYWLFGL